MDFFDAKFFREVKLKDYVKISRRVDVIYICELWQKYGLKFQKKLWGMKDYILRSHTFLKEIQYVLYFFVTHNHVNSTQKIYF